MAALGSLFITSLVPILQVLLLTAIGAILSIDRVNILGGDARNNLNNVLFYVFLPALVGSNLAKYVTYKSMATFWFMPVNVLITFVIGSVLGWLVNKITRTPLRLRGLVLGICATGNLGNLSFIMIPAVCKAGSPFGDVHICHDNAMAYATLSMAFGNIFMWSYVYNLMRKYSTKEVNNNQVVDASTSGQIADVETQQDQSNCCAAPQLALNDGALPLTNGTLDHSEKGKVVFMLENIKQGFQVVRTKLNLGRLFAPTTIGAIVGLIVGVNPPFRKGFIGENAPLHVVQDTAYMLGQAAVPCLTIIMGANLLKGLKGSREILLVIFGIVGVRNIVLPMIGVGIVKAATHFGLVQGDPLFVFVLLLQFAMPPAVNIGTMAQLFGVGESECSVIMLFCYGLASVSLTLWSMFFMWLVG